MKIAGEHMITVELPETAVKAAIVVMREWAKAFISEGKDDWAADLANCIVEARYQLENECEDEDDD